MDNKNSIRVAWLFPWLSQGNYWHPVLSKFTQAFNQTNIYTGCWTGFTEGYEDTFNVELLGKVQRLQTSQSSQGYNSGFDFLSPAIINRLFIFKPHIIFASAFSLWSLLAALLKPLFGWRLVIVYDGSSPTIDASQSKIRLFTRRIIASLADAFITNNLLGKQYLINTLKAKQDTVYAKPYQVPDVKALSVNESTKIEEIEENNLNNQEQVFLFIGQIIPRKGIHLLLEACVQLQAQGYENYTVMIIGEGPQRTELENYCLKHGLQNRIQWIGSLEYSRLCPYFQKADIFVFPTLEDVWGMVVLEAMVFGKTILCSKWAGASEMVVDGDNGYIFDPKNPIEIAKLMKYFIDNPDASTSMGAKSKELISQHTSEGAAEFLIQVAEDVLSKP
jgi:glycosyltransferase involved in cell wall biosynthesis